MALNIGKKKDSDPNEPKAPKAEKAPKESKGLKLGRKQPKEELAPAVEAEANLEGFVVNPGDQKSAQVRGGKKSRARKKSAWSNLSSKTVLGRPGSPIAGRSLKPKQPFNLTDVVLRSFPTLAKALGKDVASKGKAQKRKKKPDKPTLPIVNLLPPRFTVIRERKSAIRGFVISGLGILFAASTMYVIQGAAMGSAQGTLTASQGQIAEATGRLAQYGDVGSFFDQVQQRLSLEKTLTQDEVDLVAVLTEIQRSMPNGVTITDITITPPPTGAEGAASVGTLCGPEADPFAKETRVPVACVKISGTVYSASALTQVNNAFAKSKYLFNVLFVQGQGSLGNVTSTVINFNGTAAVGDAARTINTQLSNQNTQLPLPTNPTAPVAPTNPTVPVAPVNPGVPVNPTTPTVPNTNPTGGNN
jgi:hypothetical protein